MAKIDFIEPFNNKKVKLYESLTRFVLKQLLPENQYSKVKITFECHKNMIRDDGLSAWMTTELDKNHYNICIDSNLNISSALRNISHELVHVKQYALKETSDSVVYRGNYWDDPLEIEAYGRELGLTVRWCIAKGHDKKKWAKQLLKT